ncbi:MAG TPA: hypothetical protein VLE49_18140 [Anaerolineales bacterium]|nr:hypothetical protein [Anaerolineales bacterium]
MTLNKILMILAHAFGGWTLCAATMGIGMAVTTLDNTLVVHAIAAPIFFTGISLIYFRKFNYTTPLQTALCFLAFVVAMDFFVVAMLINRSFEMFTSILGTWLPFALIFAATYLTGRFIIGTNEKAMS